MSLLFVSFFHTTHMVHIPLKKNRNVEYFKNNSNSICLTALVWQQAESVSTWFVKLLSHPPTPPSVWLPLLFIQSFQGSLIVLYFFIFLVRKSLKRNALIVPRVSLWELLIVSITVLGKCLTVLRS